MRKIIKKVIFACVIFLVLLVPFRSIYSYSRHQDVAQAIFPELLTNQEEIRSRMSQLKQQSQTAAHPKFKWNEYQSRYTSFRLSALDKQINNFYNNIQTSRLFDAKALLELYDQSNGVRNQLERYFWVREFSRPKLNIISQDAAEPKIDFVRYWRYVKARGLFMEILDSLPLFLDKMKTGF